MSSAQELFERGVMAVREKDLATGQKLLRAALKADPNNEIAWVWLAKTVEDPTKQLKMLERALIVSPNNKHIVTLRDELLRRTEGPAQVVTGEIVVYEEDDQAQPHRSSQFEPLAGIKTTRDELTTEENIQCADLIQKGNAALNHGDEEGAIGFWLQILDIQADHPGAFPLIIRQLLQMDFPDDAKELAWRAVNAGSPDPGVADVLLRLIRRSRDMTEIDEAYLKLVSMPHIRTEMKIDIIDHYAESTHPSRVFNVTKAAADLHSDNQAILFRLAQLYEQALADAQAQEVYQQIVNINHRTEEGKYADKRLANVTLDITDKERGSVLLAIREAVGVVILYFLLAWQDVGLSLFRMDISHLGGTLLSLLGAYLVVTGSSSPEQIGVAQALGGKVDPESGSQLPRIDDATRYILMALGAAILIISFYLVFSNAFGLLFDPVPPTDIPTIQELLDEFSQAN